MNEKYSADQVEAIVDNAWRNLWKMRRPVAQAVSDRQHVLAKELESAIYEARHARETAMRMRLERDAAVANRSPTVTPEKLAEEIMARIERDGAIHRDSLIEVIAMVSGT